MGSQYLSSFIAALQRLIHGICFLSIFNTFNFDPLVSYGAYYRSGEVDWSVIDIHCPFLLYDVCAWACSSVAVAGGTGRNQSSENRLYDSLLGSILTCYREGLPLALDETAGFVYDFLGVLSLGGSVVAPTALQCPSVNDDRIGDDDD